MNGNIKNFRFWCQKVIPLVYDNSLSYYEVLCKVVHYLNHVIDDINEIPEYIDEKVKEAFDEEHIKELITEVFQTLEDAISNNNEGQNTNFSKDYPDLGTLLWHDNKLYETIRVIDEGDAIIDDVNIKLVNFGDMFNDFIDEVKENFTEFDDGKRETASINRPIHQLVWLDDVLYEVIKPIAEGNAYIFNGENKNVEPITMDYIYQYILGLIADEVQTRANEDSRIELELTDLITSRVNAEADTRATEDARIELELNDLIASEVNARVDADDAINQRIDDIIEDIGSLYIYTTFADAKASTKATKGTVIEITGVNGKFYVNDVAPSSEHYFMLDSGLYAIYYPFDFVDFKAWDVDRTTDCSTKLQDAILKTIFYKLPLQISGRYVLSNQINTYKSIQIRGANTATFDCTGYTVEQSPIMIINGRQEDEDGSVHNASPAVLKNIAFVGYDETENINIFPASGQFNMANCLQIPCFHVIVENIIIRGFNRAITVGSNAYAITMNDCRFFYNNVCAFLDAKSYSNSGGLFTFNGCSLANSRYGMWNVMFNVVLNNCNLNFNHRHVISANSDAGITSTTEVYTNCEFEEAGAESNVNMFEDNGNDYSNRIFNSCMFYISKVNRGYFWLKNGGSCMKFKNSWIRTFGSQDDLRVPHHYLVEVGNYYLGEQTRRNMVECDTVRSFVSAPETDFFKLAKSENILDTDEKGFTASGATVTYGDESITVTNSGAAYGTAVRTIRLPAKARFVKTGYQISSSASANRPYISLQCLDDSDNVLTTVAPSYQVNAGTPINRLSVIDLPVGTTKLRMTVNTANQTSGTSTTISGFYAYLVL